MTPTPSEPVDDDLSPSGEDGLVWTLPDTLASKIAAGEVVQRPANALKEMMENALDAGASRVDVSLKRAGSDLIQVTDDGCGMGPKDAVACFGRHATSKLRAFEDLERLHTLGFRGEALASIASVAQVELKTRRHQDEVGTCVRVEGGDIEDVSPCAHGAGTHLAVRNLFYNVPARRAFLRSPATEFKHLVETFQALALSHPSVAFSLEHDGNEVYRLPAATGTRDNALVARILDLMGASLDGQLVPVSEATSYLSASGVVGTPATARSSRSDQYLFINGRYVQSRSLAHAVSQAYGGLLPDGKHPRFVLFLTVDPRHVDVNVHPTKTEVKFDDDRGVYSFVRAVVKKGLGEAGLALAVDLGRGGQSSLLPEPEGLALSSPRDARLSGDGVERQPFPTFPSAPIASSSWSPSAGPSQPIASGANPGMPLPEPSVSEGPIPSRVEPVEPETLPDFEDVGPERTLWQLHGRYLLTPVRSGLLVVDQQGAHERILYERALAAMEGGMAPSQQLLFPFTVKLGAADRELLEELMPELRALGFEAELATDGSVLIRGVPADVQLGHERDVLEDLLTQYRRNADLLRLEARDNLARSLARRSAIRPGHVLSPPEARTLVDQLFACDSPYVDPAGRPTLFRLSTDEIDRRFTRQ
ncbi:MAG: DNA mismatch repair endonuclease MutL [Rubricoccaceae bacterium]